MKKVNRNKIDFDLKQQTKMETIIIINCVKCNENSKIEQKKKREENCYKKVICSKNRNCAEEREAWQFEVEYLFESLIASSVATREKDKHERVQVYRTNNVRILLLVVFPTRQTATMWGYTPDSREWQNEKHEHTRQIHFSALA